MDAHGDQLRYHRQMILPAVGEQGQGRLLAARAVIIGCGALGTAAADSLARAGVGRLTIIDRDVVELTNLQRQVLFDEQDAREAIPKAVAAARRLARVNSGIKVEPVVADFNAANAERLVGVSGSARAANEVSGLVVVDGTDNFQTRYLINDLCVKHAISYVYGGVIATGGMVMTIMPGQGPCLRCIFPEPPAAGTMPTCDTAGVLGPAVGVVGSVQAAEALKVLLGREEAISRALLEFDLWSNTWRRLDLSAAWKNGECPCCKGRRFEFLELGRGEDEATLCGAGGVQVSPNKALERIDLEALAARLRAHGTFAVTPYLLRGRLERERVNGKAGVELTVFRDGRAIIKGTTDPAAARSIYAKFVGA